MIYIYEECCLTDNYIPSSYSIPMVVVYALSKILTFNTVYGLNDILEYIVRAIAVVIST